MKENSAILKLLCGYKHLQKNEQKEAQGNLREGNFTEVWFYIFLSSASQEASAIALAPVHARHSIFAGAKITLADAWYKCYLCVKLH